MRFNKYYLAALTAFVVWGFFSLVLKPLHDFPSLDILFYRIFYAVVLLLAINLGFRREALRKDLALWQSFTRDQKRRTIGMTVAGGVLLTANWFIFIYAINHVSLKSASFAYLICPIVTTVLAYFILKETLSKWQWLAIGISALSCAILSYGSMKDLLYSLVIALTFALYLIIQRKYNQFDRLVVLSAQIIIVALLMLPFFPAYSGPVPVGYFFYTMIGIIAVVFTIIPLFLNLYALKGMDSAAVGILMYINPMINFLLAVFWFKEDIDLVQIISYGLILVSVIIFNERILFKRNARHEN
ncbi:MAG: EamA family transporter [Flavobacterium sp. BFFFF1]|uniref:EamA family transporter n=1 Tax=Flavobacterium sp. BFFFF1 TaxID=2015557 RepID=UPI000BC696CE|nr:EamA family transporter [Flavobacterium sp. BFFFF1]OYU79121.1 MAG: EamA family transporter [Flavobacterium sp. BFFFF1]